MDEPERDDTHPGPMKPPPGLPTRPETQRRPAPRPMAPPPGPPIAPMNPGGINQGGRVKWIAIGVVALLVVGVSATAIVLSTPTSRVAQRNKVRPAPVIVGLDATPDNPAVGATVSVAATVTPQTADLMQWHLVSPPGSKATLSSKFSERPTFTADVSGSYTLELVVTDNSSGLSSPLLSLTVTTR